MYVENVISNVLLFCQTNFSPVFMFFYSSENTGFLFAHLPQQKNSLSCLTFHSNRSKKLLECLGMLETSLTSYSPLSGSDLI